ncbi:MAG: hypothetical protein IJ995_02195 [Clostridia bacterium]|nr:hypothetical protein [Clostridia bacterium]
MKKILSIVLSLSMMLAMLMSLTACGSSIQDDWTSIIVGENVPTPQKGNLHSGSNLDDYFSGSIDNVSEEYYNEYVKACVDMGYTVDSEKRDSRYEAFNDKGYEISLSYISGDMHIIIQSPEELSEITWPTSGIGSNLPAPVSSLGKITSDSSDCFRATIGNTTIDDYNNFVKSCEQKGFVVDYIKQDGRYEAKNAEGYRLNTSYLGCNRIDIMIQTTEEESNATSNETTPSKEDSSAEEISEDFKKAMDGYEKFMNEYVSFMKKYKENPSDMSLLSDYATYMSKYADFVKDFENWENQEMNAAETAYYIDVQARVSKKLLEVAQ